MKKNHKFKYEGCGLPNVWLANGYKLVETPYGKTVSINDIDGLHEAIGRAVALSKASLTSNEVRFLRLELSLSQKRLGELFGVDSQTVARWEKGSTKIPTATSLLFKILYLEHCHMNESAMKLVERLQERDKAEADSRYLMRPDSTGWVAEVA